MNVMDQAEIARCNAIRMLAEAGIVITDAEKQCMEIVDFGLGELEVTGLQIVVYENNDRYCAKELVMTPRQTCPEHRHPSIGGLPGKRETFRVRAGVVRLYVPGEPTPDIAAVVPKGADGCYTVFHQITLEPGQQYTLEPDTLHWFQAGDQGAIVSEFSSTSRDESDIFTDSRIRRVG